jgi:predicted RND superfamily exporter protein
VTLAAAPGLMRLKLRTDGHALVSAKDPAVVYDRSIRDKFGIQDQLVVLIRPDDTNGVFNPATIQLVRDLTAELKQIPGINPSNVLSMATEPSFHLRAGSLIHQTLLEPPLRTRAELEQLREDLRRIELYTGTFVSADGKATVILLGVPPESDRTALYRQVAEVARKHQPPTKSADLLPEITVTGAPVAESLLGLHILEDLGVPRSLLGIQPQSAMTSQKSISLHELRLWLARRVGLVPVAALVMMLVLFACFRNVVAMLVPLPGVAATLVFVFGLMGWCNVPIYLTMAVMPVLLIATGATNDIYLFNRYFNLLREKPGIGHTDLLAEAFDKLALPVAGTSLTAGIGFLSFTFSPLAPVKAFGVFTGIGTLFGLLYSLTAVPALLTLLNPKWLVRSSQSPCENGPQVRDRSSSHPSLVTRQGEDLTPNGLARWFAALGEQVVRRRWWVVGATLAIAALTPLGVSRLVVQDSWIDAFEPDSELRRVTQVVNEEFYGMHLLLVSFDLPKVLEGELPASAVMRDGIIVLTNWVEHPSQIAGSALTLSIGEPVGSGNGRPNPSDTSLRTHIEMVYEVGGRVSARIPTRDISTNFWEQFAKVGHARFQLAVHSHVRPDVIRMLDDLAGFIRQRSQCAVGGVLGPADYVTTTRFMARPNDPNARQLGSDPGEIKLMWDYYALALGQQRLRQIVDTNYCQSLTTVFLKDANFVDTARLMADLRTYEREHLTPKGIRLGFAGDVALSQSLIQGIVSTQLQSLFWSVLGIYLVTALLGGSLRWGIFCVLPSLLGILVKFAIMGWAGIPLGVATSMFAAMTLGIGVNCAIQLLESYRDAADSDRGRALQRAMALTGPPALINTIVVSLGFGVLMLSEVPANARLGLLVVLGLVNCFIASLVLLPVLLRWWPAGGRRGIGLMD